MAGEWRTASVSELQRGGILLVEDGNHGEYRPRPDEFVDAGVAFIRAADMDAGRVLFESASKINERARQRITKGIGAPGDVLLSHKGTVGKVALVPDDAPPFVCSPQTTFWRTLETQTLDRQYLHAFLRSPGFHAQLATRAGETDMAPYVSLTSQRGLLVTLPPITVQHAIAQILGTLDDKIELNRQMNETLEAIARALFKSWFVAFEPVRAKAEGRGSGLPQSIADLFPDSFQDGEQGEIPKGWETQAFADTVEMIGGGTPKTSVADFWNGDIPWFSVVDAPTPSDVWVVDTEKRITHEGLVNSSTRLLPLGTTIISARGTVGRIALAGVEMAMNQSCYGLRSKTGDYGSFTYFATRELVTTLQQRAHGSVFDTITRDTLAGVSVVMPSAPVIEALETMVHPALERIRIAVHCSRTLSTLRDTLLPKLISGEMRVRHVQHKPPPGATGQNA